MKILKKTTAMLLGLLSLNYSSIAQQHNKEMSMSVYPWYLESWVWVTAGLILGALVVSALRGGIRERRDNK